MKTLMRWCKFNLVGAMGMAVQLVALSVFNRWMHGHYLLATAAAIELTLLHNFAWHWRYTWRDRRADTSLLRALLRFHLSNGLVSMLGNLALMRVLVQQAHLPVLGANVVAVGCCSLLNFWLGDSWVFAKFKKVEAKSMAKSLRASCYFSHVFALLLLLGGSSRVHAQAQTATSNPDPYSHGLGTDSAYENFFVGPAVSTQGSSTKATFNGGVTLGEYWARTLGKGFNASPQFELGIVGPLPSGHPVDGLASFDFMFANKISRRSLYPFLNGGYTRFFVTGNAVNFGLGIDFGKKEESRLIRLEIRDYYLFTGPRQHVIGLRIGFGRLVAD